MHYALEGSVSHSGSTIQWLRDHLQIISDAQESEGLYFVPAFAGLCVPHWRSDARGCIVGMQMSHQRAHICRAALEAKIDAGGKGRASSSQSVEEGKIDGPTSLSVDGGGTNDKLLMQFQAEVINVPDVKLVVMETTSIGAAFVTGLAVGAWKDLKEVQNLWTVAETKEPKMRGAPRTWRGGRMR